MCQYINLALVTPFAFFAYTTVNEERALTLQGLKYGAPDYACEPHWCVGLCAFYVFSCTWLSLLALDSILSATHSLLSKIMLSPMDSTFSELLKHHKPFIP